MKSTGGWQVAACGKLLLELGAVPFGAIDRFAHMAPLCHVMSGGSRYMTQWANTVRYTSKVMSNIAWLCNDYT